MLLPDDVRLLVEELPEVRLAQPPLSAWRHYLDAPHPGHTSIAALNDRREAAIAVDAIERPFFIAQTPQLLADGLHYEQRVARGVLATREGDAHDFFNALVWLRHPQLKWALNRRQCADIEAMGPKTRSRGQYAMTHFDEAGAIVWIDDNAALACWDAHDWEGLFRRHRDAWGKRIAVTIFGHALLEHTAQRDLLPMGRTVVVYADAEKIRARCDAYAMIDRWPEAEASLANAIRNSTLLTDPQQLRPLPLAGIPGWHADGERTDFFALPCFRPLRELRSYPRPAKG
ncbi:MAG: DUF3025 domain-containing protein [Dokdonella sp.]